MPEDLDVEAYIQAHKDQVEEPDNPTIPLVVLICTGCFTGTIKFPPWEHNGRMIDQGFDFFADQAMVKKFHRCPKTGPEPTVRRGNWHEEKLLLPEALYERLLESPAVERGPRRIDTF